MSGTVLGTKGREENKTDKAPPFAYIYTPGRMFANEIPKEILIGTALFSKWFSLLFPVPMMYLKRGFVVVGLF